MNIAHHRSPVPGGTLRAEAKGIHQTRRIANYQINVQDDRGNLIASCQAVAYRKKDRWPFGED